MQISNWQKEGDETSSNISMDGPAASIRCSQPEVPER